MKAKLVVEGKEFPIEINDPELEKLLAPKKKTGYEQVAYDKEYYHITRDGRAVSTTEMSDVVDEVLYAEANYYSDSTVAENNARADKLMRQLRRFAVEHREKDIDWKQSGAKFSIAYDYANKNVRAFCMWNERVPFMSYFDSEDTAELAIKAYHDELIWYFTEYKDSL